ncbi:MAG: acetoin utilization protein AcuC [bacterium]
MPAKLVSSKIYEQSGFSGLHPLAISRIGAVHSICRELNWLDNDNYIESAAASFETLTRFHDEHYVEALFQADQMGKVSAEDRAAYNFGTMENPLFPELFQRAATTVDGSIRAAKIALEGNIAFHPAGGTHHGRPQGANGFCFFNDPVFALLTLREGGLDRIAYIDLDAHHGDGVENAFAQFPDILTLSIHEQNRWPYTGALGADWQKAIVNIPVPEGINDQEYALIVDNYILPALQNWRPEAIVITCGADGLEGDPLSKMSLTNNALWRSVLALVEQTPRAVVLGGGGYNPWTTIRCWAGLWGQLSAQSLPSPLPVAVTALLHELESDLVDEEDIAPYWISTLQDPPTRQPIRPEIETLLRQIDRP